MTTEALLPSTLSLDDPFVRARTERVWTLHRTMLRDAAESVVEIGGVIAEVRAVLTSKDWRAYVERELPYELKTAENYIGLNEWAQVHPEAFQKLKHLGPTKLYLITKLDWRGLRELQREGGLLVPGTTTPQSLEELSVVELNAIVHELNGGRPEVPTRRVMGGLTRRVSGLRDAAAELIARRDEVDREQVKILRDEIAALTRDLDEAFELSTG